MTVGFVRVVYFLSALSVVIVTESLGVFCGILPEEKEPKLRYKRNDLALKELNQ